MNFKDFLFNVLISKIYRAYLAMNIKLRPLELDSSKKCLCLAPHPDDESIGMGGTLIKNGNLFDVICLTNGSRGVDSDADKNSKVALRKEEFLSAMQNLKTNSYDFWEYVEDRQLIYYSEQFNKIELSGYDYIFIPNIIDQHRDHKAVSILLKNLLNKKKHKKDLKIIFYEVWQTLALPNYYIDISDVVDLKKNLISCYKSQLQTKNYTDKILGLNNYRGLTHDLDYVEAFCVMNTAEFKKICKIYNI